MTMAAHNFFLFADSDSDENKLFFPDNSASNFKIHLTEPLQLDNIWKVALTEIRIRDDNKIVYINDLYVLCDAIDYSVVNGDKKQPILRKVQFVKKGNWTHNYETPNYLSITKTVVTDIEFYILDNKLKNASFLKKPVSLTLHFRQYPFFA